MVRQRFRTEDTFVAIKTPDRHRVEYVYGFRSPDKEHQHGHTVIIDCKTVYERPALGLEFTLDGWNWDLRRV